MNLSTKDQTVFSLLSTHQNAPEYYKRLWSVLGLLIAAWLGINSIWGLTSSKDTLISGWLRSLMPLENWVLVVLALLIGAAALDFVRKQKVKLGVVGMLPAYLTGVLASRYAHVAANPGGGVPLDNFIDPFYYAWERSFYLIPAIPMLVVYVLMKRRGNWDFYRLGNWRVTTRVFLPDEEKRVGPSN